MKIGILTLPLHTNYGGILQAYALQTVLERMGHEVVVFDTDKKLDTRIWKHPRVLISRFINKYLRRKPTRILYEKWYNKTYPIVSKYTQEFLDKYIHRTIVSELNALSNDYFDALVVGSDQVWRPMYFTWMYKTSIDNAYLAFARNWDVKRIAYAPSFGTEDWEYSEEQTKECGELLKLLDIVTVREKSGVRLCKEHFGVDATHVLDPTMLLDSRDYMQIVKNSTVPKSKGNMLCYVLDETVEKKAIIEKIAKERDLISFSVNSKVENYWAPIEERIQPPVETWLRGFYDAEFVVTDSFHACVFSILFKKPFLVIGNEGRGMARFQSLLSMFGLQDRLITVDAVTIDYTNINWEKIFLSLEKKRENSYSILRKAFD